MPIADASTQVTYGNPANREDLSDIIYRIDPVDTPFMSGMETTKATAVNHEWQTQALATPDSANARLEGDDAKTTAVTPTVRLGNICQISDKVARVSGTQQSVDTAGYDNALAYQEMLKGLELKRDKETILLGNQAKNTGGVNTARVTGSVLSFIKSNTDKNSAATGADPATADGAATRTDATIQIAFTEKRLKGVLSSIWTAGGKPNIVMTGAFNKQTFSTFTGRASPIEEAKSKKIVASVDAYESDFGVLKVVANRFCRARDVLVLEMDKWALAYLNGRKLISIPLSKTGDSDRRQVLSEYALEARNEKASGGIFDNTTS